MSFAPAPVAPAPVAPPPTPAKRKARAAAAPTERGFLTIDSMPYATIVANGQKLGVTPLWRVPVAAGPVKITAITADGRRQTLRVTVEPGKEARRRRLEWP